MPPLLLLFIVVSVLATAFELWLRRRQVAYVQRHRNAVPAGFGEVCSPEQHRRAAEYELARQRIGAATEVLSLLTGIAWACIGYAVLYAAAATLVAPGLTRGVVFLLAVGVVSSLLSLPVSVWSTFGVEQRFGFNRTPPGMFVRDRLKGAAVSLLLGVPLLYGVLALMRVGGLWWLYAWAGLLVLMLAMTEIAPRFIMPLFNRFTPLDGALRTRVEALLARCGFASSGLFVMDASRRSAHGNAFFSGFGRFKRIVLFDTLLDKHPEAEVEAVLAHELGHYKMRHVLTGMLRSAVILFAGFFVVGWLSRQPWLLPGFGIRAHDDALALIVCVLLVQLVGPLLGVAGNWVSRRHEFQADAFARRMVGAEPMVAALQRLARENSSFLCTDPLYALVNYSHPPVPARVERLLEDAG